MITRLGSSISLRNSINNLCSIRLHSTKKITSTAISLPLIHDSKSYGKNLNQHDLLKKDILLPVTEDDVILSLEQPLTKFDAHVLPSQGMSASDGNNDDNCTEKNTNTAICHRAFSIFLFNSKNELLLTRRSSAKLTFPSIWTNAVCSHPLVNIVPSEIDDNNVVPKFHLHPKDEEYNPPKHNGIRLAALRKLKHELGITIPFDQENNFKFISRFYYSSPNRLASSSGGGLAKRIGKDGKVLPEFGEHEVDYIFFYRFPEKDGGGGDDVGGGGGGTTTKLNETFQNINPEEVSELKYLTLNRMSHILDNYKSLEYKMDDKVSDDPHLLLPPSVKNTNVKSDSLDGNKPIFTPWFVGIMRNGGFDFWNDIDNIFSKKNDFMGDWRIRKF